MRIITVGVAGLVLACLAAKQEASKEALKVQLKDAEVPASWIYDDINAGFAEAKKSGKPMLVVFR